MDDEILKKIEALENRRSQILFVLCEDHKVYHPEILLGLVQEIRGITNVLKILKGSNG